MTITGTVISTGRFTSQCGRLHYLISLDNGIVIYCPNTKKVDNTRIGGCDALKGHKVEIDTVAHPKYPKLVEIRIIDNKTD